MLYHQKQIDTALKVDYEIMKKNVSSFEKPTENSFPRTNVLKFTAQDGTELEMPIKYDWKQGILRGIARIYINDLLIYDKKTFGNINHDDIGLDYVNIREIQKLYASDPMPLRVTNRTLSARINSRENYIRFIGLLLAFTPLVLVTFANIILPLYQ